MTNLLIGTNALFTTSLTVASSTATGYSADNIKTGGRGLLWKAGTTGTAHTLRYQTSTGGNNYYWIGRADLSVLDDAACTFLVDTSIDGVTYATWHDAGALTKADLVGPNAEDYIYYNATPTAANRVYTRLNIGYDVSGFPTLSKFYRGTALDLGRDPIGVSIQKMRASQFAARATHIIELEYTDVSYANTLTLLDTVAEISDYHPVVLFTTTNHAVLNGWKAIHVRLVDCVTPQEVTNRNNVFLRFEELI